MVFPASTPFRRLRHGVRRATPALGLALTAALAAGCGTAGTGAASPEPGAPTSASSSATPVTPAPSPTGTDSAQASPRPSGPAGRLLGAGQVPAFDGVTSWAVQSSGAAGAQPSGICQEYDFATIGATSAVERTFAAVGKSTPTVAERVVTFPDTTNAARAAKVLASFRDRCQTRLASQLRGLRVSDAVAVPVEGGSGSAYTSTWRPAKGAADQGPVHTEAVGAAVRGKLIAVITLSADGTGAAAVHDPMAAALAAADRLLR